MYRTLRLTLLVLALLVSRAASAEPLARAVEAIGITVSDVDRAVEFFTGVLDFEQISEREIHGPDPERLLGVFGLRARVARLRLGREIVELTEYLAPRGRPIPQDSSSNDLWFQHIAIVVSDMDAAYARLRAAGVGHVSSGPQRLPDWNPAAGGIEAFYFLDPDGHTLELIYFPPGKGDERWHETTDRTFLGIDHTAIAVADTDRSVRFYRDLLGLRVAGESENHGREQELLNGVFGARLRITGLRTAAGPAIELLEYLAPRTGRPAPSDLMANDLVHWQTTLRVPAIDAASRGVLTSDGWWVSPGPVSTDDGASPIGAPAPAGRGMLVRDPDGHGLLLIQ